MSTAKYVCLRFFIVPVEEHLFAKPVEDQQKLRWFSDAFLVNKDHQLGEKHFAVRISESRDGIVFGKLSKRKFHATHPKTDDDIKDVIAEDWPYLEFACDCSAGRQLLVIEDNSAVIYGNGTVRQVIEKLAGGAMFQHGYAVHFEPIVDKTTFWHLVDGAEGVFSLSFVLNSPNLFGAESSANEALKRISRVFNNTRTKITLENERGRLKVPKEEIETYREYADKGGGEWAVTVRNKGRKRAKRKHSSAQRALKIAVEKQEGQTFVDRLKSVYMNFLDRLK